jgi:hypothetical protein
MHGQKEAGRSNVFAFRLLILVSSPAFYRSLLNVDLRKAALTVCLYIVQAGV